MAENTPRRALPDAPAPTSTREPARARPSRLATWHDRYALVSDILTPQRVGLVLVAVVLLVTGALGGLDAVRAVEAEEIPTAQPGEVLAVAPFTIAVTSLRQGDALPPVARAEPGVTYYMAVLDITNTGDTVVDGVALAQALGLDAPGIDPASPQVTLYRVEDSLRARGYQPGVPVPSVAVWKADASAARPAEVTLTLSSLRWHQFFSSADAAWEVDEPVRRLTLPVKALAVP